MLKKNLGMDEYYKLSVEELDERIATLFTGFIHAHEIFHQIAKVGGISVHKKLEWIENFIADAFAKNAFEMKLNLFEKVALGLAEKILGLKNKRIKEMNLFNLSYDSPEFLLTLHHLGIDLDNIEAGRIDNLPDSNISPSDKENTPSIIRAKLPLLPRQVNIGL
jgi:hypothetical protein